MKANWFSPSTAIARCILPVLILTVAALPVVGESQKPATLPEPIAEEGLSPSPTVTAAPVPSLSPGVADIARLQAGGVSPQVILEFIRQTREKYRLTAEDILYLNQKKVPSEIIAAMMQKRGMSEAPAAAPATLPVQPAPQPSPAPTATTTVTSPIVQTVYTPYPYPVYREVSSPYFAPAFYFPFRYSTPYYHYPVRAYWQPTPTFSFYANTQFHHSAATRTFVRNPGFRRR